MVSLPDWRFLALALFAGLLFPFSFAPYGLYLLSLVCLAVFFYLCLRATRPRRAALYGFLFGLGMWSSGVYWVYISIHVYGHVDLLLSVFLSALFIVFLALFPALAACIISYWRRYAHSAVSCILMLAAVWVLVEWFRGWFMTGFPWLLVGYSQIEAPPALLASLVGVYGLSMYLALVAACLLRFFLTWRKGRGWLSLTVAILLYYGPLLLPAPLWTAPVGKAIKVSLVQGNIPQDIKWLPSMQQPTLALYSRLTAEHWASDLIIWPESAIPLFLHEAMPFVKNLSTAARRHGTDMLIGVISEDPDSGRFYNSVLATGSQQGLYHKRHLVPFTEYLPWRSVLGSIVDILDVPMSNFSAGPDGQRPLAVAGHQAAISICYEDAFGEESISALPQAGLLVNVSNDAWFGGSVAPWQHLQMARMRALESERPMLRATNTGITAVMDARGRIVAQAPQFEATVLDAVIQPRQGSTPYIFWGNVPVVVVALLLLALIFLRAKCCPGSIENGFLP